MYDITDGSFFTSLITKITFLYLAWIKNAWFDEWKWDDISFLLFKCIVNKSGFEMRLKSSKWIVKMDYKSEIS